MSNICDDIELIDIQNTEDFIKLRDKCYMLWDAAYNLAESQNIESEIEYQEERSTQRLINRSLF